MAWYPGANIGRLFKGEKVFPGLRGGIDRQRGLKQRAYDAGGQPAPQYDAGTMGAFQNAAAQGGTALGAARGAQGDALGLLGAAARGEGPSVAQAQLAQQNASNVATQQAMAAQGRGGNLAAQQRQASAAGAAGAMAGQQQLAQLRAGEMMAAQNAYAGQANAMADQGLQQQMGALGLQGAAQGQQLAAGTQWGLGQRGMDLQQLQGNREFGLQAAQGVMGAIGSIGALGMMSDERRKTAIAPGGAAAADALAGMDQITFDYQPGAGPPGRRIGTTAQSVERVAPGAVINTPDGKVIDRDQGLGLVMAGSANQEQRLRALERVMPTRDGLGPHADARFGIAPDASRYLDSVSVPAKPAEAPVPSRGAMMAEAKDAGLRSDNLTLSDQRANTVAQRGSSFKPMGLAGAARPDEDRRRKALQVLAMFNPQVRAGIGVGRDGYG